MGYKLHQDDWRGLPVFDAIGRKFHLTIREMRHTAPSPWMLVWDLLATAILVLGNVHGYRDVLPVPLVALLWFSMIIAITVFYLLILVLCVKVSRRFSGFFIYFPVVGFIAMTITTFVGNFNYSLMSGEVYSFELASSHLLFNIALGFLFETLFMLFVFPVILADFDKEEDGEEAVATARSVFLAGKTFAADEIDLISSQDHYLEVKTPDTSELLRGRMSDVVGQLAAEDGVTPHRSHWVARRVIESVGGKSGAKTLVLKDGTQIPIARARVAKVQAWLES